MNGWSWLMFHNFLNPLKLQLASVKLQPLYILLSGPRPSTSSSQPRSTVWLCLGISKPSTSSSHLRLLCSSGRVDLGRTQVGTDVSLHHSGNPRACVPSGQTQIMLEHHHHTPAPLILNGGVRLMFSGHTVLAADWPG